MLSYDEKKKILESHLFLQQKKDGSIKGRLVAGGDKQRLYTSKHDVRSPTCHSESIFLVVAISASERRDFAIVDFPNSFPQTNINEVIVVFLDFISSLQEHILKIFFWVLHY